MLCGEKSNYVFVWSTFVSQMACVSVVHLQWYWIIIASAVQVQSCLCDILKEV